MNNDKYVPILISKINPDEPLCADIFLCINNKFIKFKEENDSISAEKYDLFISKGVQELYIHINDKDRFELWLQDVKTEMVDKVIQEIGEENRPLIEKRQEIKEKVYDVFSDRELDRSNVKLLTDMVKGFVEEVSKNKMVASALAMLTSLNSDIAEHSVKVANLAVFIGMVSGVKDGEDLQNLYIAGIFHDYGKAKIPAEVLENPTGIGYSQAIQDHPKKAATMLKKMGTLPEIVLTMVEQHHENYNGKGFPNALQNTEIHPLSKILTIANVYDNQLSQNKNRSMLERHKVAIKFLEYDRGKVCDPALLPRVIDALNFSFASFSG